HHGVLNIARVEPWLAVLHRSPQGPAAKPEEKGGISTMLENNLKLGFCVTSADPNVSRLDEILERTVAVDSRCGMRPDRCGSRQRFPNERRNSVGRIATHVSGVGGR